MSFIILSRVANVPGEPEKNRPVLLGPDRIKAVQHLHQLLPGTNVVRGNAAIRGFIEATGLCANSMSWGGYRLDVVEQPKENK